MIGINARAVLVWIAPDGRQLHLAGGADQRREGVSLDEGLDGVGTVDSSPAFDAAITQIGESIAGWEYGHGEVDLPITVLGDTPGDMQAIREDLKRYFPLGRAGWLAVNTPVTGWRWLRCHRRSMKPGLAKSPYLTSTLHLDLVLIAEDPRAETAPVSSQWRNSGDQDKGNLWVTGGDEWPAWPTFVIHGPGRVTLSMSGSKIVLPALDAGERALLQTDPARSVLRSIADDGTSTNRWPDVEGYLARPIPAGEMTRVGVRVSGGSRETAVMAHTRVHMEGLL